MSEYHPVYSVIYILYTILYDIPPPYLSVDLEWRMKQSREHFLAGSGDQREETLQQTSGPGTLPSLSVVTSISIS